MPPAARVSDMHTCPMVTGVVPHVGGPVLPPCCPTVMTGGPFQARVSDMATCAGPPDVIAMGAATVLIQGLPAARQTDMTAHGGLVTLGLPTVLIGGAAFQARPITQDGANMKYGNGIVIPPDPSDPTYQSQVLAALIRLETTPTMRAAFDAIDASGRTVTVVPYDGSMGTYNATTTADNPVRQLLGLSSDSTIAWNPSVNGFGPPGTTPPSSQPGSDIILAHEMIHATHNATATPGNGPTNKDGLNVSEERNTTGLPASTYSNPSDPTDPLNGTPLPATNGGPYTENQVRQDYANAGIPSPVTGQPPVQRPSYYSPTPTDGPGGPF